MNEKDLFAAIGEIDDDKILDALKPAKKHNVTQLWMRWGTVAACAVICLLVGIGMFAPKKGSDAVIDYSSTTVSKSYTEEMDFDTLSGKLRKLSFVTGVNVIEHEPLSVAVYVSTEDEKDLRSLRKIDPDGKYIKAVYYDEGNERKSAIITKKDLKELEW